MSTVGIIPIAKLAAANQALQAQGFGPGNFSVPAWYGPAPTHAAFHSWADPAFEAACAAIPGVILTQSNGDPVADTLALIQAQGAQWGAQAPELPSKGQVTKNTLYQLGGALWRVIQSFSRTTYGADPSTYPALIRGVRDPNVVVAWKQPMDQYDSYKLVNSFTGGPDTCLWTDGKVYATLINNNTYSPAGHPAGWKALT